jgi:hypothetical protein
MNKQLLYFFVFQNLFLMLPVQQHSHNIICCCSNWTYQECHHCEDLLTLDTSPLVPYINCLLPVPPQSALTYQVSLNLPLPSHALTPPQFRPTPPTARLPPISHFPPLPLLGNGSYKHPYQQGTSRVQVVV